MVLIENEAFKQLLYDKNGEGTLRCAAGLTEDVGRQDSVNPLIVFQRLCCRDVRVQGTLPGLASSAKVLASHEPTNLTWRLF